MFLTPCCNGGVLSGAGCGVWKTLHYREVPVAIVYRGIGTQQMIKRMSYFHADEPQPGSSPNDAGD